eukprot:9482014-Pyramimonas_sp.AAC.1
MDSSHFLWLGCFDDGAQRQRGKCHALSPKPWFCKRLDACCGAGASHEMLCVNSKAKPSLQ